MRSLRRLGIEGMTIIGRGMRLDGNRRSSDISVSRAASPWYIVFNGLISNSHLKVVSSQVAL